MVNDSFLRRTAVAYFVATTGCATGWAKRANSDFLAPRTNNNEMTEGSHGEAFFQPNCGCLGGIMGFLLKQKPEVQTSTAVGLIFCFRH